MADPFTALTSALADRYTIERELGRGGAAAVFLAEDLRHHRKVALKILRPEVAEAVGPERFLREIEVAAGLTHPHIVPLYDSGNASGALYFVMPFVEGESLRDRLERDGALPVEEAVRITRELADALGYAHAHGVIHRDVKPENVLLEAGHAVLADFGVASAVSEAGEERLTHTGVAVGTPAYMSPEQAAADRKIDGRADQYALGCLLYEMLTGQPPFAGPSSNSVMRQHVVATPVPVAQLRPSVPTAVAAALDKAMAKAPADRFGCMEAFGAALEGTQAQAIRTPTTVTRRSRLRRAAYVGAAITLVGLASLAVSRLGGTRAEDPVYSRAAVLPFENRTGDATYDGLEDRVAEHLVSQLYDAGVIEMLPYRDVSDLIRRVTPEDAPIVRTGRDWATELGVDLTIRGAVHLTSRGDSLEFSADVVGPGGLLKTATDHPRGPRGNPDEAIQTLGGWVVAAVAGVVAPGHQLSLSSDFRGAYLPRADAYWAYQEAWEEFTRSYSASIPLVQRAIALDSLFFTPWLLLRAAYVNTGQYARADSVCGIMATKLHVADRLDRLKVEMYCPEVRPAGRTKLDITRDVAAMSPGTGRYLLGLRLLDENRPTEAAEVLDDYDTGLGNVYANFEDRNARFRAMALHLAGDDEEALRTVREVKPRFPGSARLVRPEVAALVGLQRIDEAMLVIDEWHRGLSPATDPTDVLWVVGLELAAHGHPERAETAWTRALDWLGAQSVDLLASRLNQVRQVTLSLYLGRLDAAGTFLRPLLEAYPEDLPATGLSGVLSAVLGDHEAAEETIRALGILPSVVPGERWHWQSRIAAQLGDQERAVDFLRQAMVEGWKVRDNLHNDCLLTPLHGHPGFEELRRPKG